MAIKISQLPSTSVLADTNVFPIVANVASTLTSQQSTLAVLKNYVLAGNAATTTKLATARNINNIPFDGTADITITVSVTNVLHAFSVAANGDLMYYQVTDTNIDLQDSNGTDVYYTTDLGTDKYNYSVNASGNLIVTFTS